MYFIRMCRLVFNIIHGSDNTLQMSALGQSLFIVTKVLQLISCRDRYSVIAELPRNVERQVIETSI